MKPIFRVVTLVLFGACCLTSLPAQSLSVQVKAAGALANMNGFDKARVGLSAGGTVRYRLSERAGLVLDAGYALRGRREKVTGGSGQYDKYEAVSSLSAHYVQAAVSFRYQPTGRFSIHLGPYAGLRVSCNQRVRESWELAGVPGERDYTVDVTNQYEGFDFGLQLGLECEIASGLSAFLQYQQGVVNVFAIDALNIDRVNQAIGMGLAVKVLGD